MTDSGHKVADCHQKEPVKELRVNIKELAVKVEALPGILVRLDGVAKSLEEVATLMRDQATIQSDLRHLEESDRKQWDKLDNLPDLKDMKKKIDELTSAPGKWLHTVSASLVTGTLVAVVTILVD